MLLFLAQKALKHIYTYFFTIINWGIVGAMVVGALVVGNCVLLCMQLKHVTALTCAPNSSIFTMNTVMGAHSIMGAEKEGGLNASTLEIIQKNGTSSRSKEGLTQSF